MPTSRSAQAALHAAHVATGVTQIFSTRVADYVAARPDYPPALFAQLANVTGLPAGAAVADVAAGTGLFTQGLLGCGWQVTAVEPSADMRAAADARLAHWPGYRSVAGQAEALPLADGSLRLISAAQAAHWFDEAPARQEFLRVLAPAGWLVLASNDRVAGDALQVRLDELMRAYGGEARRALAAHELERDPAALFGAGWHRAHRWPHTQWLDARGLQALVFSRSGMPPRASAAGEALQRDVAALAPGGTPVAVHYETTALIGQPG